MFRKSAATLLLAIHSVYAQPSGNRSVVVPSGTILAFSVVQGVSSATAKTGDKIELELARPLVIDGETVLAAGTKGVARIKRVRQAGRSRCKDGNLRYTVDSPTFSDLSIARTEFFGWSDTGTLPENVDPNVIRKARRERIKDNLQAAAVAPFAVVMVVPFTMLLVAELLDHSDDCKGPGREEEIPKGRLLAVMIARDHVVHY